MTDEETIARMRATGCRELDKIADQIELIRSLQKDPPCWECRWLSTPMQFGLGPLIACRKFGITFLNHNDVIALSKGCGGPYRNVLRDMVTTYRLNRTNGRSVWSALKCSWWTWKGRVKA